MHAPDRHLATRSNKKGIANLLGRKIELFLPDFGKGDVDGVQTSELKRTIDRNDQMRRILKKMEKLPERGARSLDDLLPIDVVDGFLAKSRHEEPGKICKSFTVAYK